MRAVWYDEQGPAAAVLQVGELSAPEPGPGEVRVGIRLSGANPGDTKKRRGWLGSTMPFPRVIPHSDGAGVVESVGEGVEPGRVGRRVWVYGAQSYWPFGTAAQLTVVPEHQAVETPEALLDTLAYAAWLLKLEDDRHGFGWNTLPTSAHTGTGCANSQRASRCPGPRVR